MKTAIRSIPYLLLPLSIFLLCACGSPAASADQSLQASSTASMKTVIALSTLLADRDTPTPPATNTPFIPPTPTPAETATPLKTPTRLPTVATPWDTCDVATFVSDTVSDKVIMTPGTPFIKTWTLINSGTCTWTKYYRLVFESGEPMTESTEVAFLTKDLKPGGQVTLSVEMTAPLQEGSYQGFWKLANQDGYRFGLGNTGDPFWVNVTIAPDANPEDEFAVTSAPAFAVPTDYHGDCGKNGYPVTLIGKITTNKAGTVKYRWVGSEGAGSDSSQTIIFYGADTQEVYRTFYITKGSHYGYGRLNIQLPNDQLFDKARFNIVCTN
jgi:hypothetical protein